MELNKGPEIAPLLKRFFIKDAGLKIAAFLFAVVIWGVVLTTENPPRAKTIHNVPVSFDAAGEYQLHGRELVVRSHSLQGDSNITVQVSVPITNYRNLTMENIAASVDLSSITAAGEYMLPIDITIRGISDSSRESASPEKVKVEIDTLMSKRIPVEAYYEGALPTGYWADVASLSQYTLEIKGPKTEVSKVTKAICKIQLTGRTQSYNDAVDVTLLDEAGAEMDSSMFIGGLPSITVKMDVLPKKTVKINVAASLIGASNLAANYELLSVYSTPDTVEIIGDASVLNSVGYLGIEKIDITGSRESINEKRNLVLPEGVTLLNSNLSEVDIVVEIREKIGAKEYEAFPIKTKDLGRRLKAILSQETTDVSIQGRVSIVDLLDRNDIEVYVDLNGLKAGTYELPVSVYIGDDETTLELVTILSTAKVTVTIY